MGAANPAPPSSADRLRHIESLTDAMERRCLEYFEEIEQYGGVLPAIEAGFFTSEIADAAQRYQRMPAQRCSGRGGQLGEYRTGYPVRFASRGGWQQASPAVTSTTPTGSS